MYKVFDTITIMDNEDYVDMSDGVPEGPKILAHTPKDPNQKQIMWEAPEYLHTEKEPNWFWALGIISLGLTLIAFLLSNPLFAIIIIIGSFTLALFAARTPEMVEFEITTIGVRANTQLYTFKSLQSFRILESEDFAQLLLKSKKAVIPVMSLIIPVDYVDEIRNQLLFSLNEEDINESVAQAIFNNLGF